MSNLYVRDPKRNTLIPREVASIGAGPDAYLRDLSVLCDECGRQYKLRDSDSPALCQTCYDIAGEENAILDGH